MFKAVEIVLRNHNKLLVDASAAAIASAAGGDRSASGSAGRTAVLRALSASRETMNAVAASVETLERLSDALARRQQAVHAYRNALLKLMDLVNAVGRTRVLHMDSGVLPDSTTASTSQQQQQVVNDAESKVQHKRCMRRLIMPARLQCVRLSLHYFSIGGAF